MDQDDVRIRPFEMNDHSRVEAFFKQMGGASRAMFDWGSGNRDGALGFFEGKDIAADDFN